MSGGAEKNAEGQILIVDDDRMSLFMTEQAMVDLGYSVESVASGSEALDMLARAPRRYDLVLLDREMAAPDGMTVLRKMKRDPALRQIPVVFVTGSNDPKATKAGIDAGAFYYLAKPVKREILASVVAAALRQSAQVRLVDGASRHPGFALANAAEFSLRTLDDVDTLAPFVSNFFFDAERALPGVLALATNAVEHGLAGLGFEAKGALLESGEWRQEVDRLCAAADPSARVILAVKRRSDGIVMSVKDPGPGFAWQDYVSGQRVETSSSHGRGIAIARAQSFDKLAYNAAGDTVAAFMSNRKALEW